MARRKATVMWRNIDEIPDRPLALKDIDIGAGYDRIVLVGIDDENYVIQILVSVHKTVMQVLDPQEKWVEDHSETVD